MIERETKGLTDHTKTEHQNAEPRNQTTTRSTNVEMKNFVLEVGTETKGLSARADVRGNEAMR